MLGVYMNIHTHIYIQTHMIICLPVDLKPSVALP